MFGSSKPTASLSSGLLARKGQARPAMRPQGFHGPSVGLDDLGWNDMGDDRAESVAPPAPVIAFTPAAAPLAPPVATVPPVLIERATLREEIEMPAPVADVAPEPALAPVEAGPVATAPEADVTVAAPPKVIPPIAVARIAREVGAAKAKAAFTLRLDADRHLRLRLASASRNRSAQALVVDALDAFLSSLPEVEGLVSQLSTNPTSRGKLKS